MFRSARCLAVLGVVVLSVVAAAAQAAPSGRQVVQNRGCAACHGAAGQGQPMLGYPRLAGQSAAYLAKQLEAFKTGKRLNTIMKSQAASLTADEMRAIAGYYASLAAPAPSSKGESAATLAAGREILVDGLWQKNIPGCQSCHGPGARGLPPTFPALAGQNAKYIETQLTNWREGRRPEGPDGLMAHIAQQLDADQIHAVAAYLASLPASGPIPAGLSATAAPAAADAMPGYFQPPLLADVPAGEFGESVRRGYLIFTDTPKYAGKYIGNSQSCSNCHTNAGRQANSAPMWGAWGMYPAYRGKNKRVNDMVMRLQGCFRYSENAPASSFGNYPPADSVVMIDLESYMYWMSRGVPTGKKMPGRGYPKLQEPPQAFSRERGKQVYAANCAVCHGRNGQGHKLANGTYAFPPLWGAHAYNWGAGMHAVDKIASFIHHNMPLGNAGKLGLQETWDVSAWVDSQPRPQDPRFNGKLDETVKKFHRKRQVDFYGKTVDGRVLGAPGTLASWEKTARAM